MSRSRAAVLVGLSACAAGCIGYLVGSGLSSDGATATEEPREGALWSPPVPDQSEQAGLAGALNQVRVSGQQRALLDAVDAWLAEDGPTALITASSDERFEPILQVMVELAARAHPHALVDAISRDTSGRLLEVAKQGDVLLDAVSLLVRDRADPAQTADAMRQLARAVGDACLVALARHLGQADPDLAAEVATGFAGTGQALFLLSVAENLPGDSAAIAAWLDRHSGHPSHSALVEAAVNTLARRDVDAAAELVQSLPTVDDDPAFDFIWELAANNPRKAIELFAGTAWKKGDIAAGWAEIDPDAAIAWFADNGMYEHGNMIFDDLLMVLARTAPARAEKILADYPASESEKSYPAAVLAEYLDEDNDALRVIAHYGLDEAFTIRRRAELWERIDSCPPG